MRAAAETVEPSADAKQVRLIRQIDPGVPSIFGDLDRLKQVAWNLLSNAIKFAPQNGRVEVRLREAHPDCELVVEDNGPGIAPEFIPFMFEPFRQADSSTTRTHKGVGLGLAIARSLVEMHGGTIAASNSKIPNQTGAVIATRLPRQGVLASVTASDTSQPASPRHTPLGLDDTPPLDGLRVLVVEDDGDARELIAQILQRCGAAVTVAASAAKGFESFARERPDVVISDIEMPGEDGYSLIGKIRASSLKPAATCPWPLSRRMPAPPTASRPSAPASTCILRSRSSQRSSRPSSRALRDGAQSRPARRRWTRRGGCDRARA